MEQITIRIRSREKAQWLLQILRALDFVESVETDQNGIHAEKTGAANNDDEKEFLKLAGLWADRDISLDSIRNQAWPRQTR